MVKYWLKVVSSDNRCIVHLLYQHMLQTIRDKPQSFNWATQIKTLLYRTGFGCVWDNQKVHNEKHFVYLSEPRCNDIHRQTCVSDIKTSILDVECIQIFLSRR